MRDRPSNPAWTCLLLVALASPLLGASGAMADSVFGLSYFGPDTFVSDARTEGRGGTGIAYTDSMNASVLQATQLVDLRRVTIGVTSTMERRGAEDATGSVVRNGLATPTVRVGLPIGERVGFGFGFAARRSTQWTLERPYADESGTIERIEREGTQFGIPFQLAVRVHPKLVLGAGMLLEKGTIRMRYDLDVPGSGDIDPSEVREDISSGVAWEISGAAQALGPVSVAGYFVGGYQADVDVRQRGIALTNRADDERTDDLPARWGVGARVDLPGRWSTGVDFERQQWSDYRGRSFGYTDGTFDPGAPSAGLQDETEVRFGIEREAVRVGLRQSTPLRTGAYWRRWHYQLEGRDVSEWGVTVGTGISLRGGWSRADVALGYGRIGSLDDNGVTESVWRLSFSIAGSERWY